MREHRSGKIPSIPELEADYDLIRELGRGGTAVVYLARDRAVARDVAIKLISPSHVRDEDAVARLIREAQTVGKLQHPHIVMLLGTRPLSDGGLALILQ
ncbi:MAG: protein kinase, partial [Gemmatimonadota bacterium]